MKQTKFRVAALPSEVSDLEIATAVFAACPDVQNLKIIREIGESPFVFIFTDGGSVTGTVTRVMKDVVELRQADGQHSRRQVRSCSGATDCFPEINRS
jgi:hypothetical protein